MAGSGQQRAQWNVALLQDALAPAYLQLLTQMATEMGPTSHFFRYWMCVD